MSAKFAFWSVENVVSQVQQIQILHKILLQNI